ncbi:MAG: hypothetical protein WAN03_10655 [Candidatus Sulfotelmatobacter sp.]
MKRPILVLVIAACSALSILSCGGYNANGNTKPPSSLLTRVVASEGVTSASTFGSLIIIDGYDDTIPRVAPMAAGTEPGMMVLSPSRNVLSTFDAGSNSIFAVDTTTEKSIGQVHLQGPSSSWVVPTSNPTGFAAVPSATAQGFSFLGAVDAMNFSENGVTATIAVNNAQTVISNSGATQLLVFSNDSDSVTVLSPGNAVPPVDTSCLNSPPNAAVCTIINDPRFDRPVYGIISGSTAYILNCGPECGGKQAGVVVFDLQTLSITNVIQVEAATWALLSGSTLYVAGTPPTNNACTGQTTMATTCGRLDIVDLGSGTVTASGIVITDGYHDKMDLNVIGQLFIGSKDCTNIGNVNNPSGEVRGCLSIMTLSNNAVFIPPDNGNVDGLQGFIIRQIEYVAEGGNLRVYQVPADTLVIDYELPLGTVPLVGYVGDVKAIDNF